MQLSEITCVCVLAADTQQIVTVSKQKELSLCARFCHERALKHTLLLLCTFMDICESLCDRLYCRGNVATVFFMPSFENIIEDLFTDEILKWLMAENHLQIDHIDSDPEFCNLALIIVPLIR